MVVGFIPFAIDAGPLAVAHTHAATYVEVVIDALHEKASYTEVDPQAFEEGQAIRKLPPRQIIDIIVAALTQAAFYERQWWERIDELAEASRRFGKRPSQNPAIRARQLNSLAVVLAKPALPYTTADLTAMIDAILAAPALHPPSVPVDVVVRVISKRQPIDVDLIAPLGRLRDALAAKTDDKLARRLATTLGGLLPAPAATAEPVTAAEPVVRGRAGDDAVLRDYKQRLGLVPDDGAPATTRVGPDRFPLRADSPLRAEHERLTALFAEFAAMPDWGNINLYGSDHGRKIIDLPAAARSRVLLALLEREIHALTQRPTWEDGDFEEACRYAGRLTEDLVGTKVDLSDRTTVFDLVLAFAVPHDKTELAYRTEEFKLLLDAVEAFDRQSSVSPGERFALSLLRARVMIGSFLGKAEADVARLNRLVGDGLPMLLAPGPAWVQTFHERVRDASPAAFARWRALASHLSATSPSRPSAAWSKKAVALAVDLGPDVAADALIAFLFNVQNGYADPAFAEFDELRPQYGGLRHDLIQSNLDALVGLLWCVAALRPAAAGAAQAVAGTAAWAYKKLPGVGPRAIKAGNAAVYALAQLATPDALGQLAMLKSRVKFGTAQKEIEKAFDHVATTLGLPREEIEELGVPTYGLEDVGVRRENFGDATAELRVNGRDVSIAWTNAGKPVKSVPAKAKSEFKEELKELQTAAKDIAAMLPAQSERIDNLMLAEKRWPAAAWRERYLDHPLIGTISRRLIWTNGDAAFAWHGGRLVDAGDRPVTLDNAAEVSLWHPIGRPTDDVLAWRDWVVRHGITQPFKQAFREIYLLTDAERRTETYSNRFAAHVLRQHQFNALCAARGWKNKLRLLVDDAYPPASRELPQFGLRAEFWIEGVGDDTNDSGVYLYVATDQVRFYRTSAATNLAHAGGGGYTSRAHGPGQDDVNQPLPLEQVPPLVLSEILRDVDLFVGVGSVGNDPAWQDGGPGGRYREYWQSYGFGDLTATAHTRRDVLARLLPRLTKLRDRWQLTDRFLVVRGQLRTYKIHLGSGNILMEPNDQYLCIVPDRSAKQTDAVLLPFEGDGTLSIILSKALLLAADDKIADTTITRQIKAN